MGVYCYTLRSDRTFGSLDQQTHPIYHYKYAFKLSASSSPEEEKYQGAQQTRSERALHKLAPLHNPEFKQEYYFITADKYCEGVCVYVTNKLHGWFYEEGGKCIGTLEKHGKYWRIKKGVI